MECINCHREINDSAAPHSKTSGEKKPDCAGCHLELAKTPQQFKTAGERRSLRIVAENIEAYETSSHAELTDDDPPRPEASCNDCHDVHSFNIPAKDSPARAEWRLGVSDLCGTCHDAHLEEWSESVHGKAVKEKNDPKAANCADCHTAHSGRQAPLGRGQAGDHRELRKLPRGRVQVVPLHLSRPDRHARLHLHREVLRLPQQSRHPALVGSGCADARRQPPGRLPEVPQRQEGPSEGDRRVRELQPARHDRRFRGLPADLDRQQDHGRPAARHLRLLLAAHPALVLSRIQGAQGAQGAAARQGRGPARDPREVPGQALPALQPRPGASPTCCSR